MQNTVPTVCYAWGRVAIAVKTKNIELEKILLFSGRAKLDDRILKTCWKGAN